MQLLLLNKWKGFFLYSVVVSVVAISRLSICVTAIKNKSALAQCESVQYSRSVQLYCKSCFPARYGVYEVNFPLNMNRTCLWTHLYNNVII